MLSKNKNTLRKQAFETIYKTGYWGSKVKSGAGSTLLATEVVRDVLVKIIKDYEISSIVDAACGDLTWMPSVLENLQGSVKYTGCDIVENLIAKHKQSYPQHHFQCLDIVNDKIPKADLIICREVFQHLPVNDIKYALKNISNSGAKYLLTTLHLKRFGIRNWRNIRPGRCRDRNLLVAPFNLPNPLVIYSEAHNNQDKFLALWALPFYSR